MISQFTQKETIEALEVEYLHLVPVNLRMKHLKQKQLDDLHLQKDLILFTKLVEELSVEQNRSITHLDTLIRMADLETDPGSLTAIELIQRILESVENVSKIPMKYLNITDIGLKYGKYLSSDRRNELTNYAVIQALGLERSSLEELIGAFQRPETIESIEPEYIPLLKGAQIDHVNIDNVHYLDWQQIPHLKDPEKIRKLPFLQRRHFTSQQSSSLSGWQWFSYAALTTVLGILGIPLIIVSSPLAIFKANVWHHVTYSTRKLLSLLRIIND